jgi:hypothetical protein
MKMNSFDSEISVILILFYSGSDNDVGSSLPKTKPSITRRKPDAAQTTQKPNQLRTTKRSKPTESSLYIGGSRTTTPAPPTTPDSGSG